MERSEFSIKFEGESCIDAELLLTTVDSVNQVCKSVAQFNDGDSKAVVKIKAFPRGSFEILFDVETLLGVSQPLIPIALKYVPTMIEILKGKLFCRGVRPANITHNGDKYSIVNENGEQINIGQASIQLVKSDKGIEKSFESLFRRLVDTKRESVSLTDLETNDTLSISSDQFEMMSIPVFDNDDKMQSFTERMRLRIVKQDYTGNAKWLFESNGKKIEAKIVDELYLEKVRNREYSFKNGTSIDADVEIKYYFRAAEPEVKERFVTKVHNHIE